MKIYEPGFRGTHTIRYTLQDGEYKGTFCLEIGGNCKGGDLLDSDIFDMLDNDLIKQSDCSLKYNEEYDCYECVLHDENGDELLIEDYTECDMKRMIVSIEIADYQPECQEGEENE
jgi:hypothetical protein